MELSEPIVVQSPISNIKYMEDPIEHEQMYHMETYSSSGIKRKGDHNLEDETPSKKQCEYKYIRYTKFVKIIYYVLTKTILTCHI